MAIIPAEVGVCSWNSTARRHPMDAAAAILKIRRIFLADSEEVCEDNLEQTGISFRFENADFEDFVSKVCSYMGGVMFGHYRIIFF